MTQNDAGRIFFIFETLPNVSRLPFVLCFLIISLYFFIGYVFLAAIGIVIFFCVINYFLAKWSAAIQKRRLKTMDARIQKVTEVVDNIKLIKFNSWIYKYMAIVNKSRNIEVIVIVKKLLIWVLNVIFYNLNYPLLAVSIFMIAILGADILITVPTALAILQLLNNLNNSARSLPNFMGGFIEFLISMTRIQEFLDCEEADLSAIEHKSDKDIALRIEDSNFFWGFEKPEEDSKKNKKKSKGSDKNNRASTVSKKSK